MASVGVRSFRNDLRHWLERAAAGEEIVITDRGKPIAKVGAVRQDDWAVRRQRLIDAGILIPARKPKKPWSDTPTIPARGSVVDLFLEDKRKRDY